MPRSQFDCSATAAVLAAVAFVFSAPAQESRELPGHVPAATRRLSPRGALAGNTPMRLTLSLPLRNTDGLTNLVRDLGDPGSPAYRQYLTPGAFAEQFGPAKETYDSIVHFAQTNGWKIAQTHPNRTLLEVTASAAEIERALRVKLRRYLHPTEDREFYAPDREPFVDARLPIQRFAGLNNFSRPRPRASSRALADIPAQPKGGSGPNGYYLGLDFRAAYAPGVTLAGAGQTVGLVEFDGYYASDITSYVNRAGLTNVPLQNVLLDGFNGVPTRGPLSGNTEVALDIEMVVSMAPGVSKLIVYEAGPYGDSNVVLNRIATDNLAKQISCSWELNDADETTHQILMQFAAQGQTFFNASGDDGARPDGIPVGDDDPYMTLVGGTSLTTSGPRGAWVSETVWNWGEDQGASSGGVSTNFSLPSWQQGVATTANQASTTQRNVPDVAMVADDVLVIANRGQQMGMGGTSVAAPLWAGLTALVNEQLAATGQAPVGFLNPALYRLRGTGLYHACFHDITTGDSTHSTSPSAYYATSGYDLCTGLGTPGGAALINALALAPGALRITLGPVEAVSAGARWRVDDGPWQGSDVTVSNLFAGTHTLSFSAVSHWLVPTDQTVTINSGQSASLTVAYTLDCGLVVSAGGLSLPASASGGVVAVSANTWCDWTAAASAPWLAIVGGGSGSGPGVVRFTTTANTSGTTRSAMLTIAGQAIAVTQAAPGWFAHPVFGWLWDTGSGWLGGGAYGWMWFTPDGRWIWSTALQGWLGVTDSGSRALWSPQFRWLTPSAGDPHSADTSSVGTVHVGIHGPTPIAEGWVVSDRFGYIWPAGDGTWFYSTDFGWLGVTAEGAIWCVNQGRFL